MFTLGVFITETDGKRFAFLSWEDCSFQCQFKRAVSGYGIVMHLTFLAKKLFLNYSFEWFRFLVKSNLGTKGLFDLVTFLLLC